MTNIISPFHGILITIQNRFVYGIDFLLHIIPGLGILIDLTACKKDKISDYKTWYEKALDCRDAIADLREQESKLYEQKFNNLKDEYDDILDQFDHTQKMLEGYIDLTEAQGYISSSKYYDSLIENENEKLNNLTSKRNDLINSLNEAQIRISDCFNVNTTVTYF